MMTTTASNTKELRDKAEEISLVLLRSDYEALTKLTTTLQVCLEEFINRAITCYEYLWNAHHEGRIIFVRKQEPVLELDLMDLESLRPSTRESNLPEENSASKVTTILVLKTKNLEKVYRKAKRQSLTDKQFLANAIRTYYFIRTYVPVTTEKEISLYIGHSPEAAYRYKLP